MHYFFLFPIYLSLLHTHAELICNGNFQAYSHSVKPSSTDPYAFIDSNTSCWFNKNMLIFQVKKPISPQVTIVCELVSSVAYTLCQNVRLVPSVEYLLTFSILNPKGVTSSVVAVYLNSTILIQAKVNNEKNILTFWKNFTSVSQSYELCFQPKSFTKTLFNFDQCGPCVDNITLENLTSLPILNNSFSNQTTLNTSSQTNNISSGNNQSNFNSTNYLQNFTESNISENLTLIGKKQFQIYCTSDVRELEWSIRYTCKYQLGGQIIYITVKKNIFIIFQGQVQDNYQFIKISLQEFVLDVFPDRQYDLSRVSFLISQSEQISYQAKFKFFIDGRKIFFNILSKKQVQAFKAISPITQQFAKNTKQIHQVLRSVFCSFIITNLISFWNLILMYNFLNIQTIPQFSKLTLQKLAIIAYKIDSITEFIKKTFNLDDQTFDFSGTISQQKMEKYRNSFAWFGYMGMSTGAVNNNFQSFVVLIFLIVKLFLVHLIKKWFKKVKIIKISFRKIIFNEFLGNTPIYILSAGTDILNTFFLNTKDKINTILQLTTLFFCILGLHVLYLNSFKKQKRKRKKRFYNFIQVIMYFTIPICTIFGHQSIFLLVNGVIIVYRFIWLLKNMKQFGIRDKIFNFLMNFVWVCHHIVYCIFFFLTFVKKNRQLSNQEKDILVICGMISLFTILSGAFVEGVNILIEMILFMVNMIKDLRKKYLQNKKSKDKNKWEVNRKQIEMKKCEKKIKILSNISNQQTGFESKKQNRIKMVVKIRKKRSQKGVKRCKGQKLKSRQIKKKQQISKQIYKKKAKKQLK